VVVVAEQPRDCPCTQQRIHIEDVDQQKLAVRKLLVGKWCPAGVPW
jgi:hypothetical protein